jgi:cation diffusion facilitator family transporter
VKEGSRRVVIAAFLANLGIAIAKFVGFFFTGSASMLAEAVHSVADTGNQGLLLLGGVRARRAPTPEHPFGYGRERYFWAFIVAMMLFSRGSLFALYEGVAKLRHPHALESPSWAIGILLLALLLESSALRTAAREVRRVKGGEDWWSFIRRAKSPELPVVLLEDMGAVTGLCFALLGIGLAMVTGEARFDAAGSIAIGLLLGVIAVVLASEMKSLLIGEAAGPSENDLIHDAIFSAPHVRRIYDLRTLHLGPDQLLVAAKLELDSELSFREVARALDEAEARVRAKVPGIGWMYLEPQGSAANPVHAPPNGDPGSS